MKLKIDVTQEDIDKGTKNIGNKCPIYRALKRVKRNVRHVTRTQLVISSSSGEKYYYLPPEIETFVSKFDYHEFVKPFSGTFEFQKAVI